MSDPSCYAKTKNSKKGPKTMKTKSHPTPLVITFFKHDASRITFHVLAFVTSRVTDCNGFCNGQNLKKTQCSCGLLRCNDSRGGEAPSSSHPVIHHPPSPLTP